MHSPLSHPILLLTAGALFAGPVFAQSIPEHVRRESAREALPFSQRQKYDDYQVTARFWYESRNPQQLPDMDEALESLVPQGRKYSARIKYYQDWTEAQKCREYHDAGAVLMAKAYTLLYYGRVVEAAPAIKLLQESFPYSMFLYQNRQVDGVLWRLRFHEHCCAIYSAMKVKMVPKLVLPLERDEFDGDALRHALTNQATLRLREGYVEALEHYFTSISESGLQTAGGDWAIYHLYDGIRPFENQNSFSAWQETLDAVRLWQKRYPESAHAKLAEARLSVHCAIRVLDSADPLADHRERLAYGLLLMDKIPPCGPAWYETKIALMMANGVRITEVANVFRAAVRAYPGYTPTYELMARKLVSSGEDGLMAVCEMLKRLVNEDKSAIAGQLLRRIAPDPEFNGLAARLGKETWVKAIKGAVDERPESTDLRSDLGYVAIMLGDEETARLCMKGMRARWSHARWGNRWDIAERLASSNSGRLEPIEKPARAVKVFNRADTL